MNNDKFRNEFAKKITKAKNKTELFVKKFIVDLDNAIVSKTPIDKGALHWNWFIGVGTPNTSTEEHTGKSKKGAMDRNKAVINSIDIKGQTIYISNSLEYAHVVEYGRYGTGAGATVKTTRDGYSIQAPYGMLRISLVESQQIANKVGIELKAMA